MTQAQSQAWASLLTSCAVAQMMAHNLLKMLVYQRRKRVCPNSSSHQRGRIDAYTLHSARNSAQGLVDTIQL